MKLREQLDVIQKDVHEFKSQALVELAEIKRDLSYHIRRTNLLEARIEEQQKMHTFLTVVGRLIVVGAAGAAILGFAWRVFSPVLS